MKKLSILLIGLLLVTGFAFGQEDLEARVSTLETVVNEPAFAISGYGQVTFGVNLDGAATGFLNDSEAKLAVTIYANHAPSKKGEGEAYGEIAFKDFRVFGEAVNGESAINARSAFDYAKIVAGDLEVKIAGAPTIESNLESAIHGATVVAPTDHNGVGTFTDLATFQGTGDQVSASIATSGGVTVTYNVPDAAKIEVGLASVTSWETDSETDNAANDYAFYALAEVTAIDNATISVRATTGIGVDDVEYPLGFGAKFEYSLAFGDYTLVPIIAADIVQAAGADEFDIAIGNGVRLQWPGPTEFDLPHGYTSSEDAWSGVTVGYTVGLLAAADDPVINVNAAIVEDEAEGLVPDLGFVLAAGVDDILADGDLQLGLSSQISYVAGDLTPYARIATVPVNEATTLWAGLKIANVLPLTSLEFAYQSGNLQADENTLGVLKSILKVSY